MLRFLELGVSSSAVSGVRAEYVETRELKLVRIRRALSRYHSNIELLVSSAVLIFKPVFVKLLQHLPHIPPTPSLPPVNDELNSKDVYNSSYLHLTPTIILPTPKICTQKHRKTAAT